VTGTSRGPRTGTCASGYAWLQTDCTATTPTDAGATGGARFGDPCMQPTDCATGGICVGTPGAATGFCTRACADDCSCPDAYTCYNAGSISVCIPGANTCATNPDAAVLPGEDAAVLAGQDSGTTTGDDASTVLPGDDGGTTTHGTHAGGCGCATVGARGDGLASMIGLAALGLVIARRRRKR
jgi:MYXO-CTERM domain-containing protein